MGSVFSHLRLLAASLLLIGLAACQESGTFTAQRGSPAGIPVALESIDGVPATTRNALTSELTAAASSRQVDLAGASSAARYRVRGYVSKETTAEGGTALAFVWDVYDAEKRRAKRLTGSSPIAGSDPAGLDKETLAKLAAMSMDEIAEFLAESKSAPTVTADASGAGPGLGFAAR
jgi:hypothetical protein